MSDNTNDETNDAAKLLTALKAERTARKETEGKLKEAQTALTAANAKATEAAAFANPNAEGLAKLVQDSAKALTAQQTGELQARVADLESQLATATKSNGELLGKLNTRTVTEEVREVARASHVREEALADVLTMGGLELKLADGRVETQDGRDVAQWLEDRKGSSPYWWPAARGAGARGMGEGTKVYAGDNPWKPGPGFNLTKQGEILRTDPVMADRLRADVPT